MEIEKAVREGLDEVMESKEERFGEINKRRRRKR